MTREVFLGWAAHSQSTKDVKVVKKEKLTAPDTERMMVTFMAWKTASEFKLISVEEDGENAATQGRTDGQRSE